MEAEGKVISLMTDNKLSLLEFARNYNMYVMTERMKNKKSGRFETPKFYEMRKFINEKVICYNWSTESRPLTSDNMINYAPKGCPLK